ncbi:MAG: succinate dehydrogenase assembly factor 2 [Proteobacteria bacterium]|nr:succinate dehydrogenase assembly factor 2 [Pseudomonadota bacterium]
MQEIADELEFKIDIMNTLRKKLQYRSCNRGFRELDIIFSNFASLYLCDFAIEDLMEYEAILNIEDAEIYKWIFQDKMNNFLDKSSIAMQIKHYYSTNKDLRIL